MLDNDNSVSIETLRADAENDSRFKSVYRGYDKKSVNEYIRTLKREKDIEIENLKKEAHEAVCKLDGMKKDYLGWQQEIKLIKIQKKKDMDNLRAQYEDKLKESLEEITKKMEAENSERNNQLQAIIDEKDEQFQAAIDKNNQQMQAVMEEKDQQLQVAIGEKDQQLQELIDEKNQQIQKLETDLRKELEETIAEKDNEIQKLTSKLQNREETERKLQESAIENYKVANAKLTEENNKRKVIISELEEKLAMASDNLENNFKMLDTLNKQLNEMLTAKFSEVEDIVSAWLDQFGKTSEIIKEQLK